MKMVTRSQRKRVPWSKENGNHEPKKMGIMSIENSRVQIGKKRKIEKERMYEENEVQRMEEEKVTNI